METENKNIYDLEFARIGDRSLLLDLHIPENGVPPYPVIVWLFGGGWFRGDRRGRPVVRLVDDNLHRHGYAIAAIDYRLSGEAKFPAQIEDCKAAIRFLRKHAESFKLDANKIGVWGFSAGAHLAALLGLTGSTNQFDIGDNLAISSQVQAVCAFAVTSDFRQLNSENSYDDPHDPGSAIAQLFGGPIQEKMDLVIRANPVTYSSQYAPPFLLIHGDKDGVVPCEQSKILHNELIKAGVDSTLYIIPDGDHGMAGLDQTEVDHILNITKDFFQKHL
ncbi:MAG: alpha/beta hydrolase [Chloroflexi bacterium]|nr:alpha/beta hydrolase [Chloroflexota bacterium]